MVRAVVVTTSTPRAERTRWLTRRKALCLCSATLLLLVILERWLLSRHTFPGDAWAGQLGMSPKPSLVWAVTRVYQQIGRPLVAVGEVLVMSAWLWRSGGRRALQGLAVALMASATCGIIKIICGPTPLWMELAHHVGTNFPSGVVTFMTAAIGYVAVASWRQGRRGMPLVLVVAIAGAGPARVLGGQHLLSDVLGGYMLGAAWLLAAYAYAYTVDGVRRSGRQTSWRIATRSAATSNPAAEPAMMRSS